MKQPNFFILGAPKCGTTSLASWLAKHPQVYISPVKETRYFSRDLSLFDRVNDYESLFRNVRAEHLAVGEASTDYIFSECAVRHILHYRPEAKFIVMLRNSAELVWSWHKQLVFNDFQYEEDFYKAWCASLQGNIRGPTNYERKMLNYQYVGAIGMHLQRVLSQAPEGRVHVILLEDLKSKPRKVCSDVLRFLKIPELIRDECKSLNVGIQRRSKYLSRVVRVGRKVKSAIGYKGGLGFLNFINNLNRTERKGTLPKLHAKEIVQYFQPDIELVENLLYRDLSHWKK